MFGYKLKQNNKYNSEFIEGTNLKKDEYLLSFKKIEKLHNYTDKIDIKEADNKENNFIVDKINVVSDFKISNEFKNKKSKIIKLNENKE